MSSSAPLVAGHARGGPVPKGPENMQGTDVPAQGAPSQFSEEELDEINADLEPDMEMSQIWIHWCRRHSECRVSWKDVRTQSKLGCFTLL
jgi:hypothetical protein